jgi:hypothetical protein
MTLTALLAASVATAADFTGQFNQQGHVSLRATASGCSNNPGPFITLDGELRLSGVNLRVILSNNERLTHYTTADIAADVVLIPVGQSIKIAKQPPQGGVGGNPWIYLQFKNTDGSDYGSPQLLGRCVQGLTAANLDFPVPTKGKGHAHSDGCSNSPGPYISLSGDLLLGGLNASIILTNNAKYTHATSADVVVDVVLIPGDTPITFAKQPPLGGAGGNPIIWVQFTTPSGTPLGDLIKLGRCTQL